MAGYKRVMLRDRNIEPVPMNGGDAAVRPVRDTLNAQMPELLRKRPVMIAAYRNQFSAGCQLGQYALNPFAFRSTGARGVDQVTHKDKACRREFTAQGEQLVTGMDIG